MDDLLLEEIELIVALEFYRLCIENLDIQIAFIPKEPPWLK